MRVNESVMALNMQTMLLKGKSITDSLLPTKSSNLRITKDEDAVELAISEKMRAQIRGLKQAQNNVQDAVSFLQTGEGALQQTTDILQRMRELVIKSENSGVLSTEDKTAIDAEMAELTTEIDRIAKSTSFNGKTLLK